MAEEPKRIPGYVPCGATIVGARWSFEVLDERERVAVVEIETDDGTLTFAVNRQAAEDLRQKLELFLLNWAGDPS